MIFSELSNRYATALFLVAKDDSEQQLFLGMLAELSQAFSSDKSVHQFIESPLVSVVEKTEVLKKTFAGKNLPPDFENFVFLLAKKGRLILMPEIALAFQAKLDEKNHVKRGHVTSASALSEKQKIDLQKLVEGYANAKVVLDYSEDASLVGGLSAQVGSITFDDSLASHLVRLQEDLTRSAHS